MKILKIFSLVCMVGIISCTSPQYVTVNQVSGVTELTSNAFLYALPQSVVQVKAYVSKQTFIPGPFAPYANRLLSLENVRMDEKISYGIDSFRIQAYYEADPNNVYKLVYTGGQRADFSNIFNFTAEGIIVNYPPSPDRGESYQLFYSNDAREQINFFDYSVKRNLFMDTDTSYRVVFRDSAFVKTPILKKQLEAKSVEKKAEEAANFIIKTRKRRFKLAAGQYEFDKTPSGEALKVSIQHLDEVEKEYMELFIGKTITETEELVFDVIPHEANKAEGEKIVLFRFSKDNGVFNPGQEQGDKVVLEMSPLKRVQNVNLVEDEAENNVVYYRIPELTNVKISIADTPLVLRRQYIYQYGTLATVPVTFQAK